MKRTLALLLALLLLLSATAFADAAKEPVKVKFTSFEAGWDGPEEGRDVIIPEIARRTGVEMELGRWIITSSDEQKRQLNLWVSSDDLPEILMIPTDTYTVELMNQLGDAGKLWDITELKQKIAAVDPQVEEMLTPAATYYQSQASGKQYILPTQVNDWQAMIDMDNICQEGILIRKDWLDQLGLAYPKTPDELYSTLAAFKEQIKEVNGQSVIPMLLGENFGSWWYYAKMFFDESDSADPVNFNMFHQREDGKYTNNLDQDKLADFAVWMNRAYREGILDRETSTIKDSQYQEKMTSGRVGSTGQAWWNMNTYNDSVAANIDPSCFYVFAPFPKAEGVTTAVQQFITPTAPCALVFSKKLTEEQVSAAFDMLAYMSTPEGVILGFYGIEGDHWIRNDEGKIVTAPAFLEKTAGDWNQGAHEGVGYYAGLGVKIGIINDQIAPYDYLNRPDVVESRKNLQGTVINANKPQDLAAPGPVQTKKNAAIAQQFGELIVQCFMAESEDECRQLIATWPELWATLGGEEIATEKTELVAAQ